MQSEKDKIMELLTITEVKEGGEVNIYRPFNRNLTGVRAAVQRNTAFQENQGRITRIGRGMPTQAYYSCICVKD